jgi:glycosyltransferase involved in cell wall biosynthesis
MRIALVVRSSNPLAQHPDPGSAAEATRVISLAQALSALGHRVTVYARRDSDGLPDSAILAPGVTVEHVTAGPAAPVDPDDLIAYLPEFGASLAQHWRRNTPDMVHAYFWTMGLAALTGARGLDVPVTQTFGSLGAAEHRHSPAERAPEPRSRLEACIARSSDVVLASSGEELVDLARLGVPRAKARVVPCGVDPDLFSPEGPAAERGARPRLLLAEPLTAPDGPDLAVGALAQIPDAELVITGGTGPADPAQDKRRRDLMRLAKSLQVADRLVFTGPVAPDELPALLRSADLLVSATAYEPVGMMALQAMACGTPVVAFATGAPRDAVVDLTTGVLLPPGRRAAQVALRIRRLLANSMRLEAYGIAAADRARSRYAWGRIAKETLAAYAAAAPRQMRVTG